MNKEIINTALSAIPMSTPDRRSEAWQALGDVDFVALRTVLREARYTEEGIREALGTQGTPLSPQGNVVSPGQPLKRRSDALSTFVRLFHVGAAVEEYEAHQALGASTLARLLEAGVLEGGSEGLRASLGLSPYKGFLLAHDKGPLRPGFVPGISSSSKTLDSLTIRQRWERSLDLGVGSGVQSLLAARHSARVVGTDINPRSLDFASFNARLNDMTNIDLHLGSFFEPVAGEQFDLITSNPPNVISPDATHVFQDGGPTGDRLCHTLVQETPRFLNDGGFAVMLCQWAQRSEDDWETPVRNWLEDTGCDALVLRYWGWLPLEYAAFWNKGALRPNADRYEETLDRWMAYFNEQDIRAISFGAVIMRRSSGRRHWMKCIEVHPVTSGGAYGGHILKMFSAQDYLTDVRNAARGNGALADLVLRPDGRWARPTMKQAGVGGQVRNLSGFPNSALTFKGSLDDCALGLLSLCDGRRSLGEVLDELGTGTSIDQRSFRATALMNAVRLIEMGALMGDNLQ